LIGRIVVMFAVLGVSDLAAAEGTNRVPVTFFELLIVSHPGEDFAVDGAVPATLAVDELGGSDQDFFNGEILGDDEFIEEGGRIE
jgi:hypothetical protein